MKLLITAATWNEVSPLEKVLTHWEKEGKLKTHAVEISITGIGGVATAYHLGKILPTGNWDLVMQLGIAGSFKKEIEIGAVVNVTEEQFADLGAEDGDEFLDAFEIELLNENKFPFENGKLLNRTLFHTSLLDQLPIAKSISVNKVHGNEASIQKIISKYQPDVESMEGAAFFYSCKMSSVPFIEIRSISNFVERRDKSKWNIHLAIEKLNETAMKIVDELLNQKKEQ
ncbi:MAG: futalosine hydrolase [Chitinophagales bacterium]